MLVSSRVSSCRGAGSSARALIALLVLALTLGAQLMTISAADAVEPADQPGIPWIQSDQDDYAPGSAVHLTGGSWQAGESVHIYVNDDQGRTWERNSDVVADEAGGIVDDFNLPDWFVATYQVLATGEVSGTATTSFTDSNINIELSPSDAGGTITRTLFTANATCSGSGTVTSGTGQMAVAGGQSLRLDASATGSNNRPFQAWTRTSGNVVFTVITGTNQRSICIVGEPNNGAATFRATYGPPATASTATAVASNLNPSSYGTAVTFTATVTSSPTNPTTGTVTFRDGTTVLCNQVALNGNQATCTTPALVAGTLSVGSHSITATYNPSAAFSTSTSAALTQQVDRRTLTGSFTVDNKVYDGTTAATIASRSLSGGVVPGQTVNLAGGTATFVNKNIGVGKTVTGTGFSLTGANAGNYQLASSTLTTIADIAARGVTVGFTAQSKVYDGTTAATIGSRSLTGVAPGDTVTVTGGTAVFANKNAGNGKPVTASGFVLGGTDGGNYTVTSVTPTSADITPLSITGSFSAADRAYDRTAAAAVTNRSLVGAVSGDDVSLSGGTAAFADSSAGVDKTVTLTGASLSGVDKDNYTLTGVATTTATISPKDVTGSFTADDKTYDGDTSATVLSRNVHGVLVGDTLAVSGGTASFADKNVGTDKTVTLSGATLSGADKDNYSLTSVGTTTADITARSLTGSFTAADKVYDGDNTATVTDRSVMGVVGQDVVALTGGTATFADKHVGVAKTVTLAGAVLSGADEDNYTLDGMDTAQADITARQVSGSFTADDKPYDGNVTATIATRSLTGVLDDDDVQLVGGTATFGTRAVGADKTVTGTGFGLGGEAAGDYALASTTLTTSADITALGINANFTADDKDYDGTTAATVTSRTLSGFISGDDVHLVGGAATFGSKDAGVNRTVTLTGASLLGEDAANYALIDPTPTTTATIFPRKLFISASDKSKTYGNANPPFTGSISGIQADEDITLSFTTAATAASGVGTYAIVPHANAADGVLDNYELIASNGTLTIGKRAVEVTADPQSKTYGETDPQLSYQVTQGSLVFGDEFTGELDRDPGQTVGTYAITQGSLALDDNYELSFVAGELTIGKRAVEVTADPQSKTYGETDPQLSYQVTQGSVVFGDEFTGELDRDPGQTVGTYAITQGSLALDDNYDLTFVGAKLTINLRDLTVTANDRSKTYGNELVLGTTAFATGAGELVDGDTVTAVTLSSAGAAGTATVAGSPYGITPSDAQGSGLANYDIHYVNGSLTVGQRPLTITADDRSKTYGNELVLGNAAFGTNSDGLVNGDTVASVTLTSAGAAATAGVAGSPYDIVASAAVAGPATDLGNYAIAYVKGKLTVDQRALTITVNDRSKTYGNELVLGTTGFTTGAGELVNGDTVASVTLASAGAAATATVAGSPYAIVASDAVGSGLDNYDVHYADGALTVNLRDLTITANDRSKTYGNELPLGDGRRSAPASGIWSTATPWTR